MILHHHVMLFLILIMSETDEKHQTPVENINSVKNHTGITEQIEYKMFCVERTALKDDVIM